MQFADYVNNSGGALCAPLVGFPGKVLTQSTVKENLHNGVLQGKR